MLRTQATEALTLPRTAFHPHIPALSNRLIYKLKTTPLPNTPISKHQNPKKQTPSSNPTPQIPPNDPITTTPTEQTPTQKHPEHHPKSPTTSEAEYSTHTTPTKNTTPAPQMHQSRLHSSFNTHLPRKSMRNSGSSSHSIASSRPSCQLSRCLRPTSTALRLRVRG